MNDMNDTCTATGCGHLTDWTSRASRASRTSIVSVASRGSSDGRRMSDASTAPSSTSADAAHESPDERVVHQGARTRIAKLDRILAEGRLKEVSISIYREGDQFVVVADARCDGKTLRAVYGGWRSRLTEIARRLMSELLETTRDALFAEQSRRDGARDGDVQDATAAPRLCRAGVGEIFEQITLTPRSSPEMCDSEPVDVASGASIEGCDNVSVMMREDREDDDDECAPAVNIVAIEWRDVLRGPADSMYDPFIDGDIHMRGACTLDTDDVQAERADPVIEGRDIVDRIKESVSVFGNEWILESKSDPRGPVDFGDTLPLALEERDHAEQHRMFIRCSCRYALIRVYGAYAPLAAYDDVR